MRRKNGRSSSKTPPTRLILHYQAGYANASLLRTRRKMLTFFSLSLFLSLFLQGSWGGAGLTKPPPKPERIKHFPGIDPSKRQDAGKSHVIISEKKDKKAEKYLVRDLPFPYTSKAQFERRMEVPLGMEWNTRKGFQRGTMPRITKKVSFEVLLSRGGRVVGVVTPPPPVHGFTDLLMVWWCRLEQLSTLWRSSFDCHVSTFPLLAPHPILGPVSHASLRLCCRADPSPRFITRCIHKYKYVYI